ncbi:hypothetical protein NQ317_004951 [Molorchus minor]|uniref:RNA helicase n=1 Tax=Molorchus minor TaxID=1323400 RepID=A0ABQ9K3X1_9CUCU|nr:hypothetical protein NQ317_004951 [Molorchus minor]
MESRDCKICSSVEGNLGDEAIHNDSRQHRLNFLLYEWNKYRKSLGSDRHGIEIKISPKPVNGYLYNYEDVPKKGKHYLKMPPTMLLKHGNIIEFICKIKNIRKSGNVILTSAMLLHPYKLFSIYDLNSNLEGQYVALPPHAKYSVVVKFNVEHVVIGSFKIPVSFTFQTTGEKVETFTIYRAIIVSIEDNIIPELDTGKSPFTNNDWPRDVELLIPSATRSHLDSYCIPSNRSMYFYLGLQQTNRMNVEEIQQLSTIRKEMEPGFVTMKNYRQFWHNVIWIEEIAQTLMLQTYNMENVRVDKEGNWLKLEVPGLAEKRPSLIVGDMIDLRVHNDHRAYRGLIKKVNDKTIEIAHIDEELLNYIGMLPDIELDAKFVLNRLAYERMHQAVDQVVGNNTLSCLFPEPDLADRQVSEVVHVRDSEFCNQTIVGNYEQKTAVKKILNNTSLEVPYIVFGPPGTGKTVTIVEAILQIKRNTSKKILVCAPANAACDMLTEKLKEGCKKGELLRITSESVDAQNLNMHIVDYTNYDSDRQFNKVFAEDLVDYRIIVTTLILIGKYTGKYHPDVVFIDEAAQAKEPEATCAIGMLEKGKQIVLAGDPRQLGPSTASHIARGFGLEKSLLERLMELDLYKSNDSNFITMLKQNYRSHSTILRLPNQLFYNNQLMAMSAKSENDPLAKIFVFERIMGLYKQTAGNNCTGILGQAVEFCSVISKECREGRSPSYFNTKETQTVLMYIQALLKINLPKEDKVHPRQIGVVTPYIRQVSILMKIVAFVKVILIAFYLIQVYKIKELLRKNHLEEVEVGTTETFQGREKRIIIISSVRAQKDLLLYDKQYDLGFVKHKKRFNVAVTRAMSKLIIIGCAYVLEHDSHWQAYMNLCEELGTFCGAPRARRTQEVMDDITRKFGAVKLIDSQHDH